MPPDTHWLDDDESKPAPGPLVRIQALVNTLELEDDRDRLADPATARTWLAAHELLAPGAELTATELGTVRGVREGVRAMLVHNAGGPAPTSDELAAMRDVADRSAVRAQLDERGDVLLNVTGDTVAARLAALLLIIRDAQREGTWARFKACGNHECRWAFYDRSRNHGGTWCEMSTCGNKLKNREFRARQRGTRSR